MERGAWRAAGRASNTNCAYSVETHCTTGWEHLEGTTRYRDERMGTCADVMYLRMRLPSSASSTGSQLHLAPNLRTDTPQRNVEPIDDRRFHPTERMPLPGHTRDPLRPSARFVVVSKNGAPHPCSRYHRRATVRMSGLISLIHFRDADGSENNREREFLSEERCLEINFPASLQHTLAQLHLREVRDVALERELAVRAAFRILIQQARQPATRGLSEIECRGDDHGASGSSIDCRRIGQ
jgi:hypothetical protein